MKLSRKGVRGIAAGIFALGVAGAGFTLLWIGRGGAISPDGNRRLIKYLLEYFLPLASIAGAFYYAERNTPRPPVTTDLEAMLFALGVLAIWVLLPAAVFGLSETIESAMATMDIFKLGNTLATAAVAFIYAKSSSGSE